VARARSIFEQALGLTWLRGINSVSGSPTEDIREWIVQSTFSFQAAPQRTSFDIFTPDTQRLVEAYAYDANRMSCGAFETIASIAAIENMRRSLAWLTIKCYYAAFYSAHALLRLQGISCTQLDNRQSSRLAAIAQAYGFPPTIPSGFHSILFHPDTKIVSFVNAGIRGGGSHAFLWAEFDRALFRFESQIERSGLLTPDKLKVSSKIAVLRGMLRNAGMQSPNWLSKMRNDITYRHDYGVWYPHRSSNHVEDCLDEIRRSLSIDPLENELNAGDTLNDFIQLCLFIVNLTRTTIIDMSKVHPLGTSFQDIGPMILLRRAKMLR
jgi:hypothetical protein